MTDPLRRDPREFQRVLKMMSQRTSWQKTMLFASRGRTVGYGLGIEHYNSILFSQSLWGRALEIVKVIRAMEEDGVQPNGVTYYYICHGMANVDHGADMTGFKVNHMLPKLQTWRVAINALQASESNGYDPTETMYNSTVAACSIPEINRWRHALSVVHRMRDLELKLHPQVAENLEKCLMLARRPSEATELRNLCADDSVAGYENARERNVFANIPAWRSREAKERELQQALATTGAAAAVGGGEQGGGDDVAGWDPEVDEAIKREQAVLSPAPAINSATGVFRPRVYRQMWWKWHAIANRYRPAGYLKKRQIAPPDSPSGIPAFHRL